MKQVPISCPPIDWVQERLEDLIDLPAEEAYAVIRQMSENLEAIRSINRDLRGRAFEYAQLIELLEIDKQQLEAEVGRLQSLIRDARIGMNNLIVYMGDYCDGLHEAAPNGQ